MLAEKLAEFYHNYDPIHKNTDMERSTKLMQSLLERGRLIVEFNGAEEIVGFVESWRVNYEQFGKLICYPGYPEDFDKWDINSGNICYLSNIVIHPAYRMGTTIKLFKNEFFRQNFKCDFFVGQAYRKRHQPLKVFTRQEFYDRYASKTKEVVSNG